MDIKKDRHGVNLWQQRGACRPVVLLQYVVNKAKLAALSDTQGCIAMDPLAERLHGSNVSVQQAFWCSYQDPADIVEFLRYGLDRNMHDYSWVSDSLRMEVCKGL